ncbi:MAG: hypothetical protein ACRCV9_19075 [Burkholderiaceae bacterium]
MKIKIALGLLAIPCAAFASAAEQATQDAFGVPVHVVWGAFAGALAAQLILPKMAFRQMLERIAAGAVLGIAIETAVVWYFGMSKAPHWALACLAGATAVPLFHAALAIISGAPGTVLQRVAQAFKAPTEVEK